MSEFLRNRKLVATALVLGLGASACGRKEATCLSPPAVSQPYQADPDAKSREEDLGMSTWDTAVEIETVLPPGFRGLVVGYSWRPAHTELPFRDGEDSKPVRRAEGADLIAMRIGDGDVKFSTRIEAAEGSALCEQRPDSTFSEPQDFKDLVNNKNAGLPEYK